MSETPVIATPTSDRSPSGASGADLRLRPGLRLDPGAMPPTNEPLRIAVRRLRWFKAAFHRHMALYGRELGCTFEIDDDRLVGAFIRWLQAIDQQKPADKGQRRAFFEFAAGLMLRELIGDMPVHARNAPSRAAVDTPGGFWPEGYACTLFCLSVHAAAMTQEFQAETALSADWEDLRGWWSYRENARQDRSFPAGFLQRLLGHEPNWAMPDVFGESRRGTIDQPPKAG